VDALGDVEALAQGLWEARAVDRAVAAPRTAEVLDAAPGHHLLVPAGWTTPGGWAALWARAHRETASMAAVAAA
jgi:hypothetical protein